MELIEVLARETSLERTSRTLRVLGIFLFYIKKSGNATKISGILSS